MAFHQSVRSAVLVSDRRRSRASDGRRDREPEDGREVLEQTSDALIGKPFVAQPDAERLDGVRNGTGIQPLKLLEHRRSERIAHGGFFLSTELKWCDRR